MTMCVCECVCVYVYVYYMCERVDVYFSAEDGVIN